MLSRIIVSKFETLEKSSLLDFDRFLNITFPYNIWLQEETKIRKDENTNESEKDDEAIELSYRIDDNPPWYLAVLLGFQHYLTMFGATLSVPIIIAPALCITDDVVVGKLISSTFFMSGIATLLQTTFGNR